MNKTLIILRHAHRDTSKSRELDNGLSEKGRKQVRKIFDYYFKRYPEFEKPLLLSSSRKRCMETLQPLANKLERKLVLHPLLMEKGGDHKNENVTQFKKRVKKFLKEWEESKAPLTIVCSHGDWIPVFVKECLGTSINLKKGGWAEIELTEKPALTWLLQSL